MNRAFWPPHHDFLRRFVLNSCRFLAVGQEQNGPFHFACAGTFSRQFWKEKLLMGSIMKESEIEKLGFARWIFLLALTLSFPFLGVHRTSAQISADSDKLLHRLFASSDFKESLAQARIC